MERRCVIIGTRAKWRGQEAVDVAARLAPGDEVTLRRDPENGHDPNAIEVHFAGVFLGFIPAIVARDIAPVIDRGTMPAAFVVQRGEAYQRGDAMKVEPMLVLRW